jgi:hypothetical protein
MRSQPNRDYVSDDVVQTPPEIAQRLVAHFKPKGRVLEPCRGEGNFWRALPSGSEWCEIKEGRDFYQWQEPVDWIVTNPPWSQLRKFLQHSMTLATNIVFLVTINHLWTKARIRDMQVSGYSFREIALIEMPPNFPQSGFQLGAIWLQKRWGGEIKLSDLMQKEAKSLRGKRKKPEETSLLL